MESLNLGILAHVDAGKTSLTERLLYDGGVIAQLGSVDKGNTQTDTLDLERRRGITIRSAVAAFELNGVSVNLIDTPGHPDFIAEVERVLGVLDGAILVVSAVEGVQPQSRILMRVLHRLRMPTVIFINKIDRLGADLARTLEDVSGHLSGDVIAMGVAQDLGTRAAAFREYEVDDKAHLTAGFEILTRHDDELLERWLANDAVLSYSVFRSELIRQTQGGLVHPVYAGSALTGAGIDALSANLTTLLPTVKSGPDGAMSGTVFKIERTAGAQKLAYVRIFRGSIHNREVVHFGGGEDLEERVTGIEVFDRGSREKRDAVSTGQIAVLRGLNNVRVGDRLGSGDIGDTKHLFAPPSLESVVRPRYGVDRIRLFRALEQLADQDPLIGLRQDGGDISVTLYGEVQKEVIRDTLEMDFGVETQFSETTTIYVERPVEEGSAVALMTSDENPYMATVGLRVEPGPLGSGVQFQLDVEPRSVPLHLFKTESRFVGQMTQSVHDTLARGHYGWEVTDCIVTLDHCDYYVGDGPTKPTLPMARSSRNDFRKLIPVVLVQALEKSGTQVCEPMLRLRIEAPSRMVGTLLSSLSQLAGAVGETSVQGSYSVIEVRMAADRSLKLQRELAGLTSGEGSVETEFDGYRPVHGRSPLRPRRKDSTREGE